MRRPPAAAMMAANFARKGMTSYEVGTSTNGTPVNLACMATNPARACWSPMVRGSPAGPNTMLVNAVASITVASPLYMPAATLPRWMASPLPQAAREEKCVASRKRRPDAGRPTGARRRWAKSGYAAKEGQQRNALHVRIEGVASAACLAISPRDIYYKLSILWKGEREGFSAASRRTKTTRSRERDTLPHTCGPRV